MDQFFEQLEELCRTWVHNGLPSREQIRNRAEALSDWKEDHQINGLWLHRPTLITATIDDGIGQGIEIINLYGRLLGCEVIPLGLMQKPATIVQRCRQHRPRYLGLTVLQLDSEEDLTEIVAELPPETKLIAGGPAFKYDPEMASRCGVHFVAANVAYFIEFMLNEARRPLP